MNKKFAYLSELIRNDSAERVPHGTLWAWVSLYCTPISIKSFDRYQNGSVNDGIVWG